MIAHSVAEQLRLIDRAVTTLTRSTEAMLKASDEASLLEDICQVAVEAAGYRLAWIAFGRPDEDKTVQTVAHAGPASQYLNEIRLSWADCELGRGPAGAAIRTGQLQVITDTETDPRFAPWRETARRHRFRSVIALPLTVGDDHGALSIYASEPDAFDDDAQRLLEDLGHNLTYGIRALRMKAEHDRAVRDLAESEERYRSLIELTPDAILVHSQGTIVFANPASACMFGAGDADSLIGRTIFELMHPGGHESVVRRLDNPSKERQVVEYRLLRLDGSEFDAEVVATTITFHSLPARLLVIRDVTERKQVQEQLVQAAKLATLGEMAAGLVHELSQPLNIMRLTAEGALLFIERGKAQPDWQAQQFQLIADQAQRTAEIIDDIRIFSRRDTSPVQVFDALAAVRSAIGVLEGQMRPDGIDLVIDLPDQAKPVRGRRVQLEQVVLNLAANAHHAVKEKRETADADWQPQVRVGARRKGPWVVITVSDNGPGIPMAVRKRIFEPFFTTKEAGRGTGLGLSVSFGIINAMGGRLEVVDQEVGACFAITLPVAEDGCLTDGDARGQPVPPAFADADAHVMVVDDERTAAETLAHHLGEMGLRVSLCLSGSEAFTRFMEDPADVVITDLRMPAGDGEQLVEKLRDFDPLLPIVIVTGHLGATERLADNLQDDRCAVLKKPVALGRLGELIATFLKPPPE
ncbi:MAG: ATP-binding protein [Solirubrobacterales bacterium]